MLSNRVRIFSELVSVDAWHLPFTEKRLAVSLHADVSFATARMGGEDDSPVRFTVDLKRAELRVIIPETEQLVIDRASIARMEETTTGTQKSKSTRKAKGAVKGGVSLSVDASKLMGGVSGGASGSVERETVEEVSLSRKLTGIITSHSIDGEGSNRWSFVPGTERVLSGKPWDAVKNPLMKIKDRRESANKLITPTVRLELFCRREDLDIKNIVLKDSGIFRSAMSRAGFPNRMDAAEAYIRNKLVEEGLPSPNMSEDYAVISLAQILASDEG
ncbi:hypothetical protein BLJAPNOD_06484 [Ensifer sp. M14]|uniref:Uncharacterized protein n=1 Tax=Sinorhizobium sp. M14 TaxID=430451 RepID=A0A142BP79_9HYPH|nr:MULTISPECIES: hypothetical protein [Sinorhizobium/Ensifer group]AMP34887.1 hypothetical protein pSinB_020 [Sinorhizobium sp. M14]RDL46290.1 hypothetical protein BLJAPNOD_06484 [Ensifer sp. M14]